MKQQVHSEAQTQKYDPQGYRQSKLVVVAQHADHHGDQHGGFGGDPDAPALPGFYIGPDGSEDWWLFEDTAPAPELRSATQVLEFWRDGERAATAHAEVSLWGDDPSYDDLIDRSPVVYYGGIDYSNGRGESIQLELHNYFKGTTRVLLAFGLVKHFVVKALVNF